MGIGPGADSEPGMKRPLLIRPEAERDVAEAFDWYEGQVTGLGVEFLDAIGVVFDTIASSPGRYRKIYRDLRRALMRRFPFGVFYLESESTVTVIAVIHGRRDPKRWKNRL